MASTSSKAAGAGAVAGILVLMASLSLAESLEYPVARKMEQVDSYHGVKVSDPYRWLEDDRSEETGRWVKAENEVTFSYLDKIPYRAQVMKRLEQLYNYPNTCSRSVAAVFISFRRTMDCRTKTYFMFRRDWMGRRNYCWILISFRRMELRGCMR